MKWRSHTRFTSSKTILLSAGIKEWVSWLLSFFRLNGILVNASEKNFEDLTLDVAHGKVDKTEVATFFRKHSRKMR